MKTIDAQDKAQIIRSYKGNEEVQKIDIGSIFEGNVSGYTEAEMRALFLKDKPPKMNTVKHTNDWFWGTDVVFITSDGMAHIAVSFQSDRQFGWIHDLFVHPDARRQGYATQLLALAEQEAKERGMNAVRIMVEFEREFVLDWYERQGYSDDYPGQRFTNKYTELQKEL